ncbi:hypothetical protein CPB83DRAFT_929560 [Crepidotus variabilis]|uniref:Uncharacterized protein n=1 Tax=Crepidotus variabilis TaxID=179855 RepID=A0A9P6E111_9AGAR|nr:hypothetical protein CPB83DRAFT_929560 [Crepidotus variabilis]
MAKYVGSGHQDPSTCLAGTRMTALREIDDWKRKNQGQRGSELMWLTGSAGSGKTAIAQTKKVFFLIASRPESWIWTAFSSPLTPSLSIVNLNYDEESRGDIRLFYQAEFKKIRDDSRHFHTMATAPIAWPLDKELDEFVERSSGQFIYAKTVARFVGDPNKSPITQLKLVLQPLPERTTQGTPLDRLDNLYKQILSSVANWKLASIVLGALSAIQCYSGTRREALPMIECLLGLNAGDAYITLRNLHCITFVPRDLALEREGLSAQDYQILLKAADQHPRFYHRSFIDFLHSSDQAGPYFIDNHESNRRMAFGCLKILQSLQVTWAYAHNFWEWRCTNSGYEDNRELLKVLDQFSFISWYFMVWKFQKERNWKKLKPLRLIEKWNSDALEATQEISKTLKLLDVRIHVLYSAADMQHWMKPAMLVIELYDVSLVACRQKVWLDETYVIRQCEVSSKREKNKIIHLLNKV